MININESYRGLLAGILYGGVEKTDRTGTGTRSVFGRTIRHNMSLGFPLLTTKRVYYKHGITELLWILQGRTDLDYLHSHGLKYWDPDYKRSGRTDGTLGPVYGSQLRDFNGIDQLEIILKQIKEEPSSRRIMASFWNPSAMDSMVLPPCHYSFQIYINDGKMDLLWNQRSADVFLGVPFDICMYALLLELLCAESNYEPGQLIGNLGDSHLYLPHLEAAKEQLGRDFRDLPTIDIKKGLKMEDGYIQIPTHDDIVINNYNPHPPIKAELFVG